MSNARACKHLGNQTGYKCQCTRALGSKLAIARLCNGMHGRALPPCFQMCILMLGMSLILATFSIVAPVATLHTFVVSLALLLAALFDKPKNGGSCSCLCHLFLTSLVALKIFSWSSDGNSGFAK
ncbi:hypothetical protein L1987_08525 [Smallanthus sonchifolius]|uniref:Uncharacterized protein n=1 Tax=Smallanthus sonchifolius TaxID=185202 RepID=A0ACB9JLC4_9ASTR|nr:hypothetical protein L1987_08525 [Smallanthus sonchifolius]